jgi:phospholipid/cholesterol/gamma-HCH transport system substrate-binding protein
MAALGFANDAADSFERGGPYLIRGAADLIPTTKLLDDYRGMVFCTFHKFASVQPRVAAVVGGNGYSLSGSAGPLASLGAPNPWVYPDNLPRVNAHGGPDEPHRTRPTDPDRLRVGPPDRGEHHQSLMVDINSC